MKTSGCTASVVHVATSVARAATSVARAATSVARAATAVLLVEEDIVVELDVTVRDVVLMAELDGTEHRRDEPRCLNVSSQ